MCFLTGFSCVSDVKRLLCRVVASDVLIVLLLVMMVMLGLRNDMVWVTACCCILL